VKNITTPLLVMHGEADVRAPFRQYQMVVKLLKEHNKVFESKSYPNEPHGFRDPANRLDMNRRTEAFFEKYLKGGTGTSNSQLPTPDSQGRGTR
jgi:dipeptidyl aminopeptidase/acylaminoacyl peptidase